jgi:hypothetical protein
MAVLLSDLSQGKARTRWTEDERCKLARYVIDHCGDRHVVELFDDDLVELVREGMILVLDPGRDRVIQGISQLPWLRSALVRVLSELVEVAPEAPPAAPLDPVDQDPAQPPETPPGASYARQARRLRRKLAEVKAEQTRTADELAVLVDTILDVLPQLKRTEPPSMLPEVPKLTDCHLFVAVVGLRKDQQQSVERQVGDLVEFDFVDSSKKRPEQVGGCDLLIATRWSGRSWTREARRLLGDRVVEANSASEVVRMIREIAKPS